MLPRQMKATFFTFAGPIMRINGAFYRRFRAPKVDVRAHLGPGRERYLPGWVNVDANKFTGECDVWADLRYPLPFNDSSLKCAYSHHVIEHLPNLDDHFREVFRCLEPGGVYRVGGPNGDSGIKKFLEGDHNWFSDYPLCRRSIGGRFETFIFCLGEHLTILTESYLLELLEDAGFTEINKRLPNTETGYATLFEDAMKKEFESTVDCPHTLLMEAVKPMG